MVKNCVEKANGKVNMHDMKEKRRVPGFQIFVVRLNVNDSFVLVTFIILGAKDPFSVEPTDFR